MLQFIVGVAVGVVVGTYYECKPNLDQVAEFVRERLPKKKDNK